MKARVVRRCVGVMFLAGVGLAGPLALQARAEEDIRDIRGPKAVPVGSWVVYAVVGAALVALCVAYVIWRRRRRLPLPRSLTLLEQTLERLEGTRALMQPATAREFGIAASEVIRNYIEKRFGVIATQRTTEEFLQGLVQSSSASTNSISIADADANWNSISGGGAISRSNANSSSNSNEALARHRALLADFLQQCDFVKFARASLTVADMEALFQSARGFVVETGKPAVA